MNAFAAPLRLRSVWAAGLLAFALAGAGRAAEQPGAGVTVQPVQSSVAEETFQTLVVAQGLKDLGFDVRPIDEVEYPVGLLAIANGDATFAADHWVPEHNTYYQNAGGDKKLWRDNAFIKGGLNGYFIDKKTADKYHITNIEQLRDPKIARLFDTNGDGKADLIGCPPGWSCEQVLDHHLDVYKLKGTVTQVQGGYSALMADTITRYKRGEPILYYTWMPYWVSHVLVPGRDVTQLQVPFSSLPGQKVRKSDGPEYGWPPSEQRIVANRAFVEAHPAAKKFFSEVEIPIADVNAENEAVHAGANKPSDMRHHATAWIQAHGEEWQRWLDAARAAAP